MIFTCIFTCPGLLFVVSHANMMHSGWSQNAATATIVMVSAENIRYTAKQIDAALEALSSSDQLDYAQQAIEHAAPGLAAIFTEALDAGGWFDPAHQAKLEQLVLSARHPASGDILLQLQELLQQEVNLAMFVGATVGFQLARELQEKTEAKNQDV